VIKGVLVDSYRQTRGGFAAVLGGGRLQAARWERALFGLSIAALLFVSLFPFYLMLVTSLGTDIETLPPTVVPTSITFARYEALLRPGSSFLRYFANSLFVASITAGTAVAVASIGGYSFARLDYPGRAAATRLVLGVYLFSGILLVVPLFQVVVSLGLVDTLYSLLLTHLVKTLPLALYMLGSYFRRIPGEIEEAALMDGYSRIETLLRITLPLSAPVIVAVFLFTFVISWNEYLFASVFLKTPGKFTLPIALYQGNGGMAAMVLMSVPIVVSFLYLEKYMVRGLTVGAMDG
jgi:multiple sugar transport system permease protein